MCLNFPPRPPTVKAVGGLFFTSHEVTMTEDNRDKIIRFLASLIADILQKGVVEGKRPKIVWEQGPIEVDWHEQSDQHKPEK